MAAIRADLGCGSTTRSPDVTRFCPGTTVGDRHTVRGIRTEFTIRTLGPVIPAAGQSPRIRRETAGITGIRRVVETPPADLVRLRRVVTVAAVLVASEMRVAE